MANATFASAPLDGLILVLGCLPVWWWGALSVAICVRPISVRAKILGVGWIPLMATFSVFMAWVSGIIISALAFAVADLF